MMPTLRKIDIEGTEMRLVLILCGLATFEPASGMTS
jgi:hypothetical protein